MNNNNNNNNNNDDNNSGNACWYIKEVSHPQTFWTGIVMASTTAYIIPHKTMSDSQSVNAVFIVEVVWLVLRPIWKVTGLIICPVKSTLNNPIVYPNPALCTIQPMLNIDVFFLIPYSDEVAAICLAGFLSFSPIFARMACRVANTIKIWPARFTYICNIQNILCEVNSA